MEQITTTQNLVAIKGVRHAGQKLWFHRHLSIDLPPPPHPAKLSNKETVDIWVNSLGRHQAITWTNVDLSSVRSCVIHLRTLS